MAITAFIIGFGVGVLLTCLVIGITDAWVYKHRPINMEPPGTNQVANAPDWLERKNTERALSQ